MIQRPFGKTGLSVTPICIGTSALGSFPAQYGYEVSPERAAATLRRVLEGPVNFVDTSNEYGNGESERRIGRVLAELGGVPAGVVLATKVDPLPGSRDFSGSRVRASVSESLQRLGLDHLQVVYLHDPEKITFTEATAPGGAVDALIQLREEGVIKYLGVAGGPIDLVSDGVTGLLVPPGDCGGLAAAVARLAADPDLRARQGRAARQRVLGRTWSALGDELISHYEAVLQTVSPIEVSA